jgi:hypothetical protein
MRRTIVSGPVDAGDVDGAASRVAGLERSALLHAASTSATAGSSLRTCES